MVHSIYNVSFDYIKSGKTFEFRGGGPFSEISSVINYYLGKGFYISHLTLTRAK